MVALFAIHQLSWMRLCKLTSEDLLRFLYIPILIRSNQVGHSHNLGIVLVPTCQLAVNDL